jgi:predicted amidohydrolase
MTTRARIASICLAGGGRPSVEANRETALRLLDLALRQRPDLVCLPETFTTAGVPFTSPAEVAEAVPGPTITAVAHRARQHRCYVICPILTIRDGACFNSAVLIDRTGAITALEHGVRPGQAAPVFDMDFGRVGIQICFDVNFPEQWGELARQGARAIFWPSAYNGGRPLEMYAALHHIYVISAVQTQTARIIDPLGSVLASTDPQVNVIWRDINLDYAVCHYDFNYSVPDRILAAYPDQVAIRPRWDDALFLVEPTDANLSVAQLQEEFGFETAAQYFDRHRVASRLARQGQPMAPQRAAHGERPMYAKMKVNI